MTSHISPLAHEKHYNCTRKKRLPNHTYTLLQCAFLRTLTSAEAFGLRPRAKPVRFVLDNVFQVR
jgi:hypothetical protein